MDQIEQTHHMHDVGRILLQTQQELAQMKEQIASKRIALSSDCRRGAQNEDISAKPSELDALEAIIHKAEKDIQSKVELILKGFVRSNQTSHTILPAVSAPTSRTQLEKQSVSLFSDSQEIAVDRIRQRFREAYAFSESSSKRPQRNRKGCKMVIRKNIEQRRIFTGDGLQSELDENDAKKGVLSLINRGFVSPYTDLSPAFLGGNNSVLVQRSVRLHDRLSEPIRSIPCTNEVGFNVAALRFDMSPVKPSNEVSELKDSVILLQSQSSKSISKAARADSIVLDVKAPAPSSDSVEATAPSFDSVSDLRNNIDQIRHYNELLDTYSLHQLIIHKGATLTKTPEYVSFKRVTEESWGDVEDILRRLEQLLDAYAVPLAYIDGQRILSLAQMQLSYYTKEALLSCIMNKEQVDLILRKPGQRFKRKDCCQKAVVVIQAFYRMFIARKLYKVERSYGKMVIIIQRNWRMVYAYRRTKQRLTEFRQKQLERYNEKMSHFRTEWQTIRKHTRAIIHLPSISIPKAQRLRTDQYTIKQNLQLARVCATIDPNVEIIYISPFELPKDIAEYYTKLLELGGVHDAFRRVRFVHPENAIRFPDGSSLTTIVLYSPQLIWRLKRYVRGKEAYLVPGIPSIEEKRLAMTLEIPLLGLDATRSFQLLTRSGSKRVFARADVHSTGGTLDLCDEEEICFNFAKLLLQDYRHDLWLLKLDYDPLDAGIALVNISELPTIQKIRREKKPEEYWRVPAGHARSVRVLTAEIRQALPSLFRPVYPEMYRTWNQYRQALLVFGVVIEAKRDHVVGSVRANLFLEPSQNISLTSTQEVIHPNAQSSGSSELVAAELRVLGYAFPQTIVPHEAIQSASLTIAAELLKEELCGYISIDFVVYMDNSTKKQRLCAASIKPYLTDSSASFAIFHYLTQGGFWNNKTGVYHMPSSSQSVEPLSFSTLSSLSASDLMLREASLNGISSQLTQSSAKRCYIAFNYLNNPNIAHVSYKSFFRVCRSRGIHFDIERAIGTVFLLADSLASGIFGTLCVGESRKQALLSCYHALDVIAKEIGANLYVPGNPMDGDVPDVISMRNSFYEVFRTVRFYAGQKRRTTRSDHPVDDT